jgi:hypothetical protein
VDAGAGARLPAPAGGTRPTGRTARPVVMVARELPNNPLAAACETEADPDFETDHNFLEKQMKIKTSELTGAALDWAVAECENVYCFDGSYTPSTDWAQGGPIIEREGIDICTSTRGGWIATLITDWEEGTVVRGEGDTCLFAAMRCYVASKLGDEVEIPEEIC